MLAAYITHADCSRHEMGRGHPECPERLSAIHDQLLVRGLLDGMQSFEAPLATVEQLGRAHDTAYVLNLIAASPAEGQHWLDPDTSMNPHTVQAALRSAGAAIQATDLVIGGQAPSAFCAVRPPGHHAERHTAMGFCFFNNVAVGIRHALDVHGLQRVALIDFDVHHGNGSDDIFLGDERVLMCSVFEKGLYPHSGGEPGKPNQVNVGLSRYSGSEAFRRVVTNQWLPALDAFAPQMLFISAGFDAHRDDELGNLALLDADYTWVTQQLVAVAARHSGGKIVSCLEGGYNLDALGRCVAGHVKVLAGL